MKCVYLKLLAVICLFLGSQGSWAYCGPAMDLVKKNLSEVADILATIRNLPVEDAEGVDNQKMRARSIIEMTFDFNVLSRRSLGNNYNQFSEAEYAQFVKLFTDLLFDNYYNRIKDFTVDKVEYLNETRLGDTKAEVETLVYSKAQKYPIVYRLYKKDNVWLVYDVIVEGISMVNNYRSQFDTLLQRGKVSALLEKLKSKSEF